MNACVLSHNCKTLATAGDDPVIRVYSLDADKKVSSKVELRNCGEMAHTSVDLNSDGAFLIAACKDGFAYILNIQNLSNAVV